MDKKKIIVYSLAAMLSFQSLSAAQADVIMSEGNHVVNVSDDLSFYDDGGKDGNISPGNKVGIYTFVPVEDGYAVTVNVVDQSIGNGRVYVYSGRNADDANILGNLTGYSTTSGPKELKSRAADGSLTIKVTTPATATSLRGFEYAIGLHKRTDYALESIDGVSASASTSVMRGAVGEPFVRIEAIVKGDQGGSEISNPVVALSGSGAQSVTKASLYYSNAISAWSPALATKLADAVPAGGKLSFDAKASTGDEGTFYMFVTFDIASDAVAGNEITAALESVNFNGQPATVGTGKATRTLAAGLKGNYTIGGDNADYATFKAATDALAAGIEGPVEFVVAKGTYAENVAVKSIPGASKTNTITFRGESGDRADVVISGKYAYSDKTAALWIEKTPGVCVRDLTVDVASQGFDNVVYVNEASPYFTLTNCAVKATPVTSGYSGINLLRSNVGYSAPAGSNNDFMTIADSYFEGGLNGLYLSGTSTVANPKEMGLKVTGNTVVNSGSKGIYISNENGAVITGNTVTQAITSKKGYQAFDLYALKEGGEVSGNTVLNTQSVESEGIYMRSGCAGSAEAPLRVYNNVVNITNCATIYGYGMHITNDCSNLDIYHNTVRIGGTDGYAYATASSGTPVGIKLRNNIFQNTTTKGNTFYFSNDEKDMAGYTVEYNALWTKGGSLIKGHAANATELAAKLGNTTNVVEEAQFLSDTDAHLTAAGNLNTLPRIAGYEYDAAGKRRAIKSTAGAYEFGDIEIIEPKVLDGFPTVSAITEYTASVTTKWNVAGKLYSMVVEWAEGAEAPKADDILKGKSADVLANTEAATGLSDLTDNTFYRVFFVLVSAQEEQSAVVGTDVFKTLRYIAPLEATDADHITATPGQDVTLRCKVAGGDAPYTYSWTSQEGKEISTEATPVVKAEMPAVYTLTVKSADGQTATARCAVAVEGCDFAVGNFDDIKVDGHLAPSSENDLFFTGSYGFHSTGSYWGDIFYWSGYAVSASTSTEYNSLDDQYNCAAGGAHSAPNFGVAFGAGNAIDLLAAPADSKGVRGVYLTNDAYTFTSLRDGDGFSPKAEQGDWFSVTFSGTDVDGKPVTAEFILADLRSDNSADHYILDTWQWMDLSAFDTTKKILLIFDGSITNSYGLCTPTYVCLDDLGCRPDIAATRTLTMGNAAPEDVASFFTAAPAGAVSAYTLIVEEAAEGTEFTLDGSSLAMSGASEGAAAKLLVGRTAAGKSEYVALEVTAETSGIDNVAATENAESMVYTTSGIFVQNGTADLAPGIYIEVRGSETRKIIVK